MFCNILFCSDKSEHKCSHSERCKWPLEYTEAYYSLVMTTIIIILKKRRLFSFCWAMCVCVCVLSAMPCSTKCLNMIHNLKVNKCRMDWWSTDCLELGHPFRLEQNSCEGQSSLSGSYIITVLLAGSIHSCTAPSIRLSCPNCFLSADNQVVMTSKAEVCGF